MSGGLSKKFRAQWFHSLALGESSIPAPCNQAILQTKRPRCGNFQSEPVGACRKGWRLEVLTTLNFPAVQAVSDIFFLFLGRWC